MPDLKHYVIRGGVRGRERLKLLSRVMHESTAAVFDRAGIREGMACLDVGCGSGDVTLELARSPQDTPSGAQAADELREQSHDSTVRFRCGLPSTRRR